MPSVAKDISGLMHAKIRYSSQLHIAGNYNKMFINEVIVKGGVGATYVVSNVFCMFCGLTLVERE